LAFELSAEVIMAEDKVRLNVDVSRSVREQIGRLQDRSGAASLSEVFRRALALYDCFTEFKSGGWEVVFRHPKLGEKTLKVI
jgi:hypothetical protein